jgi:hypothetical protein
MVSCAKTPLEKAQENVKSFLNGKLKNPSSYKTVSFSDLDTLNQNDPFIKYTSTYKIEHTYKVTNSELEEKVVTARFLLDQEYKVNNFLSVGLNGEYGKLLGTVEWRSSYSDSIDAGAMVSVFSLDTTRRDLVFETVTDQNGVFSFERLPAGEYLLIGRSNRFKNSPKELLSELRQNEGTLNRVFNFNLDLYKSQMQSIDQLDGLAKATLLEAVNDGVSSKENGLIEIAYEYDNKSKEEIMNLFQSFPSEFRNKIGLNPESLNSIKFEVVRIAELDTTKSIIFFY